MSKRLFWTLPVLAVMVVAASILAVGTTSRTYMAVITYHDIGSPEEGFRISKDRFLSHLEALERENYQFLPLDIGRKFS